LWQKFYDRNGAKYHEKKYCKMNKNITDRFYCDFCGNDFTSEKGKIMHLDKCKKCFRCQYCNKKFGTQNGANFHEEKWCQRNTKKYIIFECPKCNKVFHDDLGLQWHVQGDCESNGKCNRCNRWSHNIYEYCATIDKEGNSIFNYN